MRRNALLTCLFQRLRAVCDGACMHCMATTLWRSLLTGCDVFAVQAMLCICILLFVFLGARMAYGGMWRLVVVRALTG